MIQIAILLDVSQNKNLRNDPPFLIHFLNIYNCNFYLGKFQEHVNSRSIMTHFNA